MLCGITGSTSSMIKHLECKHPSVSKDKVSKGKAFVRPVTDLFHRPINGESMKESQNQQLLCVQKI